MSDINSSLIGFLKKKSLFANSPEKNKKLRQSSRDSKHIFEPEKNHVNTNFNPEFKQDRVQTKSNKNLQKHSSVQNFASIDFDSASHASGYNDVQYQNYSPYEKERTGRRGFNIQRRQEPKQQAQLNKNADDTKNIWAGMITKAITFQSARIQSAQCLDNLIVKIQTQVSSINYRIDSFRSKMTQILDQQFANLHEKVISMVDSILQQSSITIKNYIRDQQSILAAELITMRQTLMKEYQKVELMKQQINKPNWRKVAGELLSSELEQKIENYLLKSKSLSVKQWEMKDIGSNNLHNIQRELKSMVKIGLT